MIGLVIVSAFVSCYVGLMRDPQPHRIPVAVTGPQLANKVQQALGDSIDVRRADSTTEALDALRHRDIVAVLGTSPHGKDLKLDVASANGLSTTTAVTKLVTAYAHGADQHLSVSDIVPLDRYDARGLAGFYVSFGVTLSGFALAQNVVGLSSLLHLRHRFTLMAVFAAASGLVAAAIAGPVLGAIPAPYLPLAFVLALLAAAAAFTTKMLATYVGPLGIPLATLLLLTVGNSTSGATIGTDLMPSGARTVSALLPPAPPSAPSPTSAISRAPTSSPRSRHSSCGPRVPQSCWPSAPPNNARRPPHRPSPRPLRPRTGPEKTAPHHTGPPPTTPPQPTGPTPTKDTPHQASAPHGTRRSPCRRKSPTRC